MSHFCIGITHHLLLPVSSFRKSLLFTVAQNVVTLGYLSSTLMYGLLYSSDSVVTNAFSLAWSPFIVASSSPSSTLTYFVFSLTLSRLVGSRTFSPLNHLGLENRTLKKVVFLAPCCPCRTKTPCPA